GFAAQYYQLIYGRGGTVAFRFFAFLAWGVPLLLSVVAGLTRSSEAVSGFLALPPPSAPGPTCLAGARYSPGPEAGQYPARRALGVFRAAGTAGGSAWVFAFLLGGARRGAARAALRLQGARDHVTPEPLARAARRGPLLPSGEAPPGRAASPEGIRPAEKP